VAITYVGGQTAARANATVPLSVTFALTGGSNATPQADDLVVVCVTVASQATNPAMAITTPSGYTALGQLNETAVTGDTSLNVSYKRQTATPDTTVTIPGVANSQSGQGYSIQVFRDVDATTPLDVTPVSAGGTGTARPDPGAITPTTTGAWIVICGGGTQPSVGPAVFVAPANYSTNFLTATAVETNSAMIGSGYRAWAGGTEDPAAYTGGTTGANDSWCAYTIALRPTGPASVSGVLTQTLAVATVAAAGTVETVVQGVLTQTLAPLTAYARGSVGAHGLRVFIGGVPAAAVPVEVQSGISSTLDSASVGTFARAYASPVSAGNYSIVVVLAGSTDISEGTLVDSQGNLYTLQGESLAEPVDAWLAIYTAPIGSSGPLTVTYTTNGDLRAIAIATVEVDTGGGLLAIDATAGGTGASNTPTSGSLVTTRETLLLGFTNFNPFDTWTPGAGWTERATTEYPLLETSLIARTSPAGTYAASWTNSGVNAWQVVASALAVEPPAEWMFRHDSMSIHSTLNGRDTLSGVIDILDDRDPPTLNQDIVVTDDGVRIFGGSINELEYRAITSDPDASQDLMVSLSAEDFNALADKRTVPSLASPGGLTLKQALTQLVAELTSFGVVLSPAQVDGPVLPSFAFSLQTVTAILDELAKLTEFVWEIDYDKVLTMWQPGSVAAPFNIADGDHKVWGDLVIRPIASDYANRIIVRAGREGPYENVFAWQTDGVTNAFPMYLYVLQHFGQVLVDTPLETVPGEGYESVGAPGSGALWEFHDGPRYTQYLSRTAGPPPAGNPYPVVPYPLQFKVIQEEPIVVTADNLAEQAAHGIVEKLVDQGPTVSSWWELQAIADSLLGRYSSRRHTVQYATREKGLRVGQSQTITIARRWLSGAYFITDIETQMVGTTILKRTVTANETPLYQGSWRDTYLLWAANSSGGGGGGSVAVGTDIPVGGTPVPHHANHEPGGMDPLTVDSTAAIGSLRTLGTGANQAAPGDALASYLLRADVDQIIQSGTRAAQPAATAVLPGTIYTVTDERHAVERSTGTAWEIFVRRRHVSIYAYDYSSTTTAPPASTTVRFDGAGPYTAVTKVWLHTQTNDGRDVYIGLMNTDLGTRVTIQDKNDHTIYATFTLTGAPVDHTTYVEWPVVYAANGGASLFNNQAVLVMKQ